VIIRVGVLTAVPQHQAVQPDF